MRGEVEIHVGGRSARVAFTLGVLAELEDALGIASFDELAAKLSQPTPKQLLGLMRAILRGNDVEHTEAELKRLDIGDVSRWVSAMVERVSFGADAAAGGATEGNGGARPAA